MRSVVLWPCRLFLLVTGVVLSESSMLLSCSFVSLVGFLGVMLMIRMLWVEGL